MQDLKTMKSNIAIVLTYPGIVYFNSSECFDFRDFQLRSLGPENDYILWSTKSYPTMQNPWDQKCAAHFLEKSQFAGNFFTCIPMLWMFERVNKYKTCAGQGKTSGQSCVFSASRQELQLVTRLFGNWDNLDCELTIHQHPWTWATSTSPATASWCRSDTTNCRFETAVSANKDTFVLKHFKKYKLLERVLISE